MVALIALQLDGVTVIAVPFKPLRPHLFHFPILVPSPILVPLFHHDIRKAGRRTFQLVLMPLLRTFPPAFSLEEKKQLEKFVKVASTPTEKFDDLPF